MSEPEKILFKIHKDELYPFYEIDVSKNDSFYAPFRKTQISNDLVERHNRIMKEFEDLQKELEKIYNEENK